MKTGNHTTKVDTGNVTLKVAMGNQTTDLSLGNYSLKTDVGNVTIEALQGITLKVGANSLKIDMSGVTINGIMVKCQGTAMVQTQGADGAGKRRCDADAQGRHHDDQLTCRRQ